MGVTFDNVIEGKTRKSVIVYPLYFTLQREDLSPVVDHVAKSNPSYIVDHLNEAQPILLKRCLCGETQMISLIETQRMDGSLEYQYKCHSCKTTSEPAPSRQHAIHMWAEVQTK